MLKLADTVSLEKVHSVKSMKQFQKHSQPSANPPRPRWHLYVDTCPCPRLRLLHERRRAVIRVLTTPVELSSVSTNRIVRFANGVILERVASIVERLICDVIVKKNFDPFATSLSTHMLRKIDKSLRDRGQNPCLCIPVHKERVGSETIQMK